MFGLFRPKPADFSQLGLTTDWHCHLLAGVDDGVQEIGHSAQTLQEMRSVGIKTIVHTPHFNPEIFPDNTEEHIRTTFDSYLSQLPSEAMEGLDLRIAGEYMVVDGFEHRDMEELMQIEPGKVLIEMSYMYPSQNLEETVFNIGMAGLTPVLAHPERYLYYAGNLKQFDRLHDMGTEFQLNLLSLEGAYGPASVRILEYLLNKGWYRYAGSDTHTPQHFQHIARMQFKSSYLERIKSSIFS